MSRVTDKGGERVDWDSIPPEPSENAVTNVGGRSGRLIPRTGCSLAECPTSLDLTTPKGKALAIAAGNPSDIEFGPDGRAEIVATDWIVFPDQSVNPETGELGEFARTVLFTADGKTFRTTSAHAPNRLAAALDLYGQDEWKRGIKFIISERRSRKTGHTYHDIRVSY